jgi:uncharacterized membrane protein YkvI
MSKSAEKTVDILNVLKLTGAFMAFLIGSGFATGQEIMQFFAAYGLKGILGILIALVGLIYLCMTFMRTGKELGLRRNEDVFKHYAGNVAGTLFTWYTMILIIAVHAIMLSGAGATLHQYYGLPQIVGSAAMAILSMATLLLGLNRIVEAIAGIGPVIIVMTMFIAVATLLKGTSNLFANNEIIPTMDLLKISPHWAMSGFLYIGLNILGLASFLPAVGTTIEKKKDIVYASFIGPVFYSLGLILVSLALISHITEINGQMIPIMALASGVLPIYGAIFAIVIFFGIYSTATPLLWTVCARFAEDKTPRYRVLVVALTCVGFFGGMVLPFDKLVNLIYPTIGYAGMLFLVFVITKDLKSLSRAKRIQ